MGAACCGGASSVKAQNGSQPPQDAQKANVQANGGAAPHENSPDDVPSNKPPVTNGGGTAPGASQPEGATGQKSGETTTATQAPAFGTAKSVKRMLPAVVAPAEAHTAYTRSESSKSMKEKMAKIEANEFMADDVPTAEREAMPASNELSAPVIAKPGMKRLQSSRKMMLDKPPQVLGYAVRKQVAPSILANQNAAAEQHQQDNEPEGDDLPDAPAAPEI